MKNAFYIVLAVAVVGSTACAVKETETTAVPVPVDKETTIVTPPAESPDVNITTPPASTTTTTTGGG